MNDDNLADINPHTKDPEQLQRLQALGLATMNENGELVITPQGHSRIVDAKLARLHLRQPQPTEEETKKRRFRM